MVLSVTHVPGAISTSVNSFSSSYHADYFAVRCLAETYLANAPTVAKASALAAALNAALTRWGAGKRGAPSCRPPLDIATALSTTALHRDLANLEASVPCLAINGKHRRVINPGSAFRTVADFDNCLIRTLDCISTSFLLANTNVTYPMKALLLLTGLMPAFDSQVKGGLAVAGVAGVKKTRYRLPPHGSPDAQKICALPFYIADCISRQSHVINAEISASSYPALIGNHGRIFDVLLFMQNHLTPATAVVTFIAPPHSMRWYAI